MGRLIRILIGSFIFSSGLVIFLAPHSLVDGGTVGVSMMMSRLTPIPFGIALILFNSPFLYMGYRLLGKDFAKRAVLGIFSSAVFSTILHEVVHKQLNDPMLSSITGGILLGVGVGLVVRSGGVLDGVEVVAIHFSRYLPFSVGELVMALNGFVFLLAGFVYGLEVALYSSLSYYVAFKVIDLVIEGFEQTRHIWIFTDRFEAVGERIQNELERSSTHFVGRGMYKKEKQHVLFLVVTRLEEARVKSIVKEEDPNAFLTANHSHDVMGGRFVKKHP